MDALPDELLLAVLGHLHDGRTLLDVVPLVSKRWRRLSREPEAWAGVDLEIRFFEEEDGSVHVDLDLARVLLHAPALRYLQFVVADFEDYPQLRPQTMTPGSILRRVSARIASIQLRILNCSTLLQLSVDELTALVQRNQEWLRAVDICMEVVYRDNGEDYADLSSLAMTDLYAAVRGCAKLQKLRAHPYVVSILDGLPHLTDLELEVEQRCPRPVGDWRTWSLPALRRLQYYDIVRNEYTATERGWSGQLLLALCRAAPGLTRLGVTCGDQEVSSCSCLGGALPVARALPHLPSLRRLDAHGDVKLLKALPKLPALKKADVVITCEMLGTNVVALTLKRLKVQRPDLALKVTVKVDNPQVTLKIGEYTESDEDSEYTESDEDGEFTESDED